MDKKNTILTIACVGSSVVLAVSNLLYAYTYLYSYTVLLYIDIFVAIGVFVSVVMTAMKWKKFERGQKLGEDLFLLEFGVKPDKTKVLSTFIYKYDHLNGISKNSVRIKFLSQEKVYKGIVDIENEKLYIKEPILLPVFTGDVIPVWKDVTKVHRNGMPKAMAYHDADERPRGMDYLDEEGTLKKGSWRRYKGREVYWFPEKQVWEP